jgi:hypothetical protein
VSLLVTACGQASTDRQTDVGSALSCPPERCVSLEEAGAVLDFEVLEPAFLPDEFSLDRRGFVENLAPGAPAPGSPGTSTPVGPPSSILTEFRFKGSPALPGISLIQTALGGLSYKPGGPYCAEIIAYEGGPLLYINGSYSFEDSMDGADQLICKSDLVSPRDVHNVIIVRNDSIVELIAFPEVHISKDEIIEMAKSLRPLGSVSTRQ